MFKHNVEICIVILTENTHSYIGMSDATVQALKCQHLRSTLQQNSKYRHWQMIIAYLSLTLNCVKYISIECILDFRTNWFACLLSSSVENLQLHCTRYVFTLLNCMCESLRLCVPYGKEKFVEVMANTAKEIEDSIYHL